MERPKTRADWVRVMTGTLHRFAVEEDVLVVEYWAEGDGCIELGRERWPLDVCDLTRTEEGDGIVVKRSFAEAEGLLSDYDGWEEVE